MLGLLEILWRGIEVKLTMGSSLESIKRVLTLRLLISWSVIVYSSKIYLAEGKPIILAVNLVWNSIKF